MNIFDWFKDKKDVKSNEEKKEAHDRKIIGDIEQIIDTVVSLKKNKIKSKIRKNYGEIYWIIKCENNTFRAYESKLNQDNINNLDDGSIIGRKVKFNKYSKYNHILRYDIIE